MSKILEVVIKIPKGDYDYIMHRANAVDEDLDYHETLISYGTVLPKGHGRLVDADELIDTLGCSDRDIYCKAVIEEDAPTIIEAEESEEKDNG